MLFALYKCQMGRQHGACVNSEESAADYLGNRTDYLAQKGVMGPITQAFLTCIRDHSATAVRRPIMGNRSIYVCFPCHKPSEKQLRLPSLRRGIRAMGGPITLNSPKMPKKSTDYPKLKFATRPPRPCPARPGGYFGPILQWHSGEILKILKTR